MRSVDWSTEPEVAGESMANTTETVTEGDGLYRSEGWA